MQRALQADLRGLHLLDGVTQDRRLRQDSLAKLLFRLRQGGPRCDHFGVFIFVAQGVSGDARFQLCNARPRVVHQWRTRDTWNFKQRLQLIAGLFDLFDLLKLSFKSKLVGLRSSQPAV